MPSVQVALRLMAKGKHVKAKDVMSFVITGDSGGSAENAAKNAFTLEEVTKADSGLKPGRLSLITPPTFFPFRNPEHNSLTFKIHRH